MIGESIELIIKKVVSETLSNDKSAQKNIELIETDNLGEIIEKLSILHIRTWYLEDAISVAKTDSEVADLKRKIDICFKVKRPKLVQAINKLIESSVLHNKSLSEDSVKLYKGFE